MLPLIGFIVLVIDLYIWVIITGAMLSWLIAFNVVNTAEPLRLFRRRDALPGNRAGAPADPQHPAQSRRHRHFAGDPDPVPALPPRRGPDRLAGAGRHAVRQALSAAPPLNLRRTNARRHAEGSAHAEISARTRSRASRSFGGAAVLKARVRALPEAGRANAALETADRRMARACRRRRCRSRRAASRG